MPSAPITCSICQAAACTILTALMPMASSDLLEPRDSDVNATGLEPPDSDLCAQLPTSSEILTHSDGSFHTQTRSLSDRKGGWEPGYPTYQGPLTKYPNVSQFVRFKMCGNPLAILFQRFLPDSNFSKLSHVSKEIFCLGLEVFEQSVLSAGL